MNRAASVVAETLVYSDAGLLRIADLVAGSGAAVSDGAGAHPQVTGHDVARDHETIQISTGRGLVLEGSPSHLLLLADATWRSLDTLALGDALMVVGGVESWPVKPVQLESRAVDPDLGALVGYVIGKGRLDREDNHLTWSTLEPGLLRAFSELLERLRGERPAAEEHQGRWRVELQDPALATVLVDELGLRAGGVVRDREVPAAILRSPEPVVRAFLRAYFDCDAWANRHGVILATASEAISRQVQLLLLNYRVLSRRGMQTDGSWHLHITGPWAARFAERVGFGVTAKGDALQRYVRDHEPFKAERWEDEVASIDRGRADVYTISLGAAERYAAAGFVNREA